jgi:hypothetical protein
MNWRGYDEAMAQAENAESVRLPIEPEDMRGYIDRMFATIPKPQAVIPMLPHMESEE